MHGSLFSARMSLENICDTLSKFGVEDRVHGRDWGDVGSDQSHVGLHSAHDWLHVAGDDQCSQTRQRWSSGR